MHTIKPIDEEAILREATNSKLIVTIEEHNIIGGLGSAVSEVLSKIKNSPKAIKFGINDQYSKSGSYKFLKDHYGLTDEKIVNEIKKNYE